MQQKIVLFLGAENSAGKTTIAEQLEHFGYVVFSVRKEIERMFLALNQQSIIDDRSVYTQFSQDQKIIHGAHFFIEQIIKHHVLPSVATIFIIESVRTPGEVDWIKKVSTEYIKPVLIGISASKQIRLRRYLSRNNGLGEKNVDSFEYHESLSHGGTTPHAENIAYVLSHADYNFRNDTDEDFHSIIEKIILIGNGKSIQPKSEWY